MGVLEGELKCVSEEDMALSVMTNGTIRMLQCFVDNLDIHLMVRVLKFPIIFMHVDHS